MKSPSTIANEVDQHQISVCLHISLDISGNTVSTLPSQRISSSEPLYAHFFFLLSHSFICRSLPWLATQHSFASTSTLMMLSYFLLFGLAARLTKAVTATATPYTYLGCWAEPSNVRALTTVSYASDSMTLEYCAGYCAGIYKYLGVEYGREVSRPNPGQC
jgi:WSC domain